MALEASTLECPSCGATITMTARVCDYCRTPIIIRRTQDVGGKSPAEVNKYVQFYREFLKDKSGESVETFVALGICLLKRGTYGEAKSYFEKAINLIPDDGEPYYSPAQKIFLRRRLVIWRWLFLVSGFGSVW